MDDIIIVDSQSPVIYEGPRARRGFSIEGAIGNWLSAKKLKRSGSERTQTEYRRVLLHFREYLQNDHHIDLFPPEKVTQEEMPDFVAALSDAAQAFCLLRLPQSRRAGEISRSEQGKRLSIISSFYAFCRKKQLFTGGNPIDLLERPSVPAYANSKAIDPEEVARRLAAIDTSKPEGLQEKALLCVLFFTGRRAQEVAGLRMKHITVMTKNTILLHFEQGKGGKHFYDTLPPELSALLLTWLQTRYGAQWRGMAPDTPVWTAMYHKSRYNEPMGYDAIAGVLRRHFGTSKVHVTRHTFARVMVQAGANLTEIRDQLGHANAATTDRYLKSVAGDTNPHGDKVTEILGLKSKEKGHARANRKRSRAD